MGNVCDIYVCECDVIRKIRENFVSRTFPRIRYFYHVSDRSVQFAIGTKNPETTVYT